MAENSRKSFKLDMDPVLKWLQSIRRLVMVEEITEESVDNLINQMSILSEQSVDQIEPLIDSHGGDFRQV